MVDLPIYAVSEISFILWCCACFKSLSKHQFYMGMIYRYQYIYAMFISFFAIASNEGFNPVDRICPINEQCLPVKERVFVLLYHLIYSV